MTSSQIPLFREALLRGDKHSTTALSILIDNGSCTSKALSQAGVPLFFAQEIMRKLAQRGELRDGVWNEDIQLAYQQILDNLQTLAHETHNKDVISRQDMPREKALQHGIDSLNDVELLAILMRTGQRNEPVHEMCQRLLDEHDGLLGLAASDIHQLLQAQGLGDAKACEIAAVFEIGKRLVQSTRAHRVSLRSAQDVVDYIGPSMSHLEQEELWLFPLDTKCRLIGQVIELSRGDIDGTEANPRLVFRKALSRSARSIILVHNHPSGDPTPSAADCALTQRLVKAGQILDLPLNDHIIIGDQKRFHSLRANHSDLFH